MDSYGVMFLLCAPNRDLISASSDQAVVNLGHHPQTLGEALASIFTERRSLGVSFFFSSIPFSFRCCFFNKRRAVLAFQHWVQYNSIVTSRAVIEAVIYKDNTR